MFSPLLQEPCTYYYTQQTSVVLLEKIYS